VRRHVLILLLLVPPACAAAEHGEIDPRDGLAQPAAPEPYHAEVIALPAPVSVRPLPASVTPAALDDTDAGPASVMVTSFEAASAVCNDWQAEGADAIRSVPPRSGDYACRLCATGESPELAIVREAGPLAPGRYVLTAWVRDRPKHDAPAVVTALLEAETSAGVVTATSPVVPGDAYAEVLVTIELPDGATSLRARIGAVASIAECVLIDDVLLRRVP
jgi:hypothetical protein